MKTWNDAHPGHAPVVVKVEMKDGFLANKGRGPAEFDTLVNSKLGTSLFRPADLTAGTYATLDAPPRPTPGRPARSSRASSSSS